MGEHDDDLESEVGEGAEMERDAFPDTADRFEEPLGDDDEDTPLDVDETEL